MPVPPMGRCTKTSVDDSVCGCHIGRESSRTRFRVRHRLFMGVYRWYSAKPDRQNAFVYGAVQFGDVYRSGKCFCSFSPALRKAGTWYAAQAADGGSGVEVGRSIGWAAPERNILAPPPEIRRNDRLRQPRAALSDGGGEAAAGGSGEPQRGRQFQKGISSVHPGDGAPGAGCRDNSPATLRRFACRIPGVGARSGKHKGQTPAGLSLSGC